MVAANAYNGAYTKNPYNFIHEKVVLVSVKKDGESIPGQPHEPDFENGGWVREYTSIYANCSLMRRIYRSRMINTQVVIRFLPSILLQIYPCLMPYYLTQTFGWRYAFLLL